MRKLALLCATALLLSSPWTAQAMIASGTSQLRAVANSIAPTKKAACRGWGEHCPPGYVWNGFRCIPC